MHSDRLSPVIRQKFVSQHSQPLLQAYIPGGPPPLRLDRAKGAHVEWLQNEGLDTRIMLVRLRNPMDYAKIICNPGGCDHSAEHSAGHSAGYSAGHSADHSAGHSAEHLIGHSAEHLVGLSAEHLVGHSADHAAAHSAGHSAEHSASLQSSAP